MVLSSLSGSRWALLPSPFQYFQAVRQFYLFARLPTSSPYGWPHAVFNHALLDSACILFGKISADSQHFVGCWWVQFRGSILLHALSWGCLRLCSTIIGLGIAFSCSGRSLLAGISALLLTFSCSLPIPDELGIQVYFQTFWGLFVYSFWLSWSHFSTLVIVHFAWFCIIVN